MFARHLTPQDTPVPFEERGRENLSEWLATSFSLNGLVAIPPLPSSFTQSQTHISTDLLQKLYQHVAPSNLSTDRIHLQEALGEPLFLKLLRSHDGLPAWPVAAIFAHNSTEFQQIVTKVKSLGFKTAAPDTIHTDLNIPLLAFHTGLCDTLIGNQPTSDCLAIGAGTTWKQLKYYTDQFALGAPFSLANRFETPLAAALAGAFKITQLTTCEDVPLQATIRLEKSAKIEKTFWFPTQAKAISAFQRCTELESVFYAELVPYTDIKIGTLLNYWSFGISWPKQKRYGIRLIVDKDALKKDKTITKQLRKAIKQNHGHTWHVNTLLREREKAAALLHCGAAEVSLRVPLKYDPTDPEGLNVDVAAAQSVLEDAARGNSPYPHATPITSLSAISTKYQTSSLFAHVLFPRTPGRSAEQWRDIYSKALNRLNKIFPPAPHHNIMPPASKGREPAAAHPQGMTAISTDKTIAPNTDLHTSINTSPEWQAIRDALLSDFGPVGNHTKSHLTEDKKQTAIETSAKVNAPKQDHTKGKRP